MAINYRIQTDDLNCRVDQILARRYPEISRSHIKRLATGGQLSFNDRPVNSGYRVKTGGRLKLAYDYHQLAAIPKIKLEIIYQDQALMAVNKPPGIISHARGRYWSEASIASSVRDYLAQPAGGGQNGFDRAGLVHRLDRGTSGLLLIGKTEADLKQLQRQFKNRTVSKTYLALVDNSAAGHLGQYGLIDKALARESFSPSRFKVAANGSSAQTYFQKINCQNQHRCCLLALRPVSGRSHQLRVHLASLNCPIVGDRLYGGRPGWRLWLHNYRLEFNHPRHGQKITLTAPLADNWTEISPEPKPGDINLPAGGSNL